MGTIWIVTANAGRARYFAQEHSGGALQEVEDQVNAAARLRTADTETDDLGRRTGSAGTSRGATPNQASGYEPHQTPAEHQTEVFAKAIVAKLSDGRRANRFGRLIVVASPEFLGVMRKQMDAPLTAAVRLEIDKDYTQSTATQLREQIDARRIGS